MRGKVGITDCRTDPESTSLGDLNSVQTKVIDVNEVGWRFDLKLHEV